MNRLSIRVPEADALDLLDALQQAGLEVEFGVNESHDEQSSNDRPFAAADLSTIAELVIKGLTSILTLATALIAYRQAVQKRTESESSNPTKSVVVQINRQEINLVVCESVSDLSSILETLAVREKQQNDDSISPPPTGK